MTHKLKLVMVGNGMAGVREVHPWQVWDGLWRHL